MLAITIILILGFGLFCMYAAKDMLSKTEYTIYAWCIALFLSICCIGCVLLLYESALYNALIKHEKQEVILEKQIQIDTAYSIKHAVLDYTGL